MGGFGYWAAIWRGIQFWRPSKPLENWQDCQLFVAEQAAYIAQTTLFGYLRTRAGLNHFALFKDPRFITLLRPARGQIYLVCVADLLLYLAVHLSGNFSPALENRSEAEQRASGQKSAGLSDGRLSASLLNAYDAAADQVIDDAIDIERLSELRAQFMTRCQSKPWRHGPSHSDVFAASPRALIDLAPVIDSLKEFDEEIVMNSMRFKWRSVRSQFLARANVEQIVTDLQSS